MTNINPEDFREEMQALYKKNNTGITWYNTKESKSIVFDEVSYLKDGKKEFIIGIKREKKDVAEKRGQVNDPEPHIGVLLSAHTKAESTFFVCL